MPQRNVTITEYQDRFVEAILGSGQFGNVSEVFRAGLRLLEREEYSRMIERELIHRNIEKGIADINEGRYTVIETSDDLGNYFADKQAKRQKWFDEQSV